MAPSIEMDVRPTDDDTVAAGDTGPIIYIKATRGLVSLRLGELWQYRECQNFCV
jgi:hypothetical protein